MAPCDPVCSRPLNFDITVRVGCSLAYEVTGTASLLNLKRFIPTAHRGTSIRLIEPLEARWDGVALAVILPTGMPAIRK